MTAETCMTTGKKKRKKMGERGPEKRGTGKKERPPDSWGSTLSKHGTALAMSIIVILLLASSLKVAAEQQLDVKVKLDVSARELAPGETAAFSASTYINNILVLSVPTKVQIIGPLGDITEAPLENIGGFYRGVFNGSRIGTYRLIATSVVNGNHYSAQEKILVKNPELNIVVRADDLEIKDNKTNVTGELSVSPPPETPVVLSLTSPKGMNYMLCNVTCFNCTFSCANEGLLEVGEYKLSAETTYKGVLFKTHDYFRVKLPIDRNLRIKLDHKPFYKPGEMVVVEASLLEKHESFRNGLRIESWNRTFNPSVRLQIEDPEGVKFDLTPVLSSDGFSTHYKFYAGDAGTYRILAEALMSGRYTRTESEFRVESGAGTIKLADYETYEAKDETGKTWIIVPVKKDKLVNSEWLDLTGAGITGINGGDNKKIRIARIDAIVNNHILPMLTKKILEGHHEEYFSIREWSESAGRIAFGSADSKNGGETAYIQILLEPLGRDYQLRAGFNSSSGTHDLESSEELGAGTGTLNNTVSENRTEKTELNKTPENGTAGEEQEEANVKAENGELGIAAREIEQPKHGELKQNNSVLNVSVGMCRTS
ncbi:hypothetical protein D6764_04535, partial [Candidatus Woesearchaeota archaeon]